MQLRCCHVPLEYLTGTELACWI